MKPETILRDLCVPDPNQPRRHFDRERLEDLAASLSDLGQLQPIIVYRIEDEQYGIVDGQCRWEAMKIVDMTQLQALVLEEKPDANTLLTMQLTANGQRSDLTPMEKAFAYQKLKDQLQCSQTELAAKLHISKSMVTQLLSLLQLPEEARSLVDNGKLKPSTAYAIVRNPNPAQRNLLLQQVINGTRVKRNEAGKGSRSPLVSRKKIVLHIGNRVVTIGSSDDLSLDGFIELLDETKRECSKARKQGLSLSTLQKVLEDRRETTV